MRYTSRNFKYDEGSPMERLQELENKLDDGTLLEPPCKIGDTVYAVCDDVDDYGTVVIYDYEVIGVCYKDGEWYVLDDCKELNKIGSVWAILDRAEAERIKAEKEYAVI